MILYNEFTEKKVNANFKENGITVLTGANGAGKTSLLDALEDYCKKEKYACLHWSDNEYGRANGRSRLMMHPEMLGYISFRSEGQTISGSLDLFVVGQIRTIAKKHTGKKDYYILLDQLDSGLDVHQLVNFKDFLKNTVIPDLNKQGFTVYIVITANSYECVEGEFCVNCTNGKEVKINSYQKFKSYIDTFYKEDDA